MVRGHETVHLEPKAMEVLVYIASRPSEVITREELERDVWHGALVGYDAVTNTVIKLRKALQDDARQPRFIATIPKKGYQLIALITYPEDDDGPGSAAPVPSEPVAVAQRERQTWSGHRTGMLMAALAVVFVSGLVWLWPPDNKNSVVPPSLVVHPSVVVLPFANLSNDPSQDYFSDGIGGDITTDLSRLGSLRVIARQTALSYKGQAVKAEDVASELGVRYVIDGSVQKSGERVRINVQLTDAKNGHQLWAERFDRATADLFAVQDEIAHHLVEAMSITLSKEERRRLARRYTTSVEAYDIFLRGQEAYVRLNPGDNVRAQEFYREAIAKDPHFARAYAALALTYSDDWRFQWSREAERGADEALHLARRAVELDKDLPQAYWALGFVHIFRREHDDAIRAAKRAIELDPNNADAYVTHAISSAFAGDPERAIALMGTAMALNPRYGSRYPSVLAISYFLAGRLDETLAVSEEAIALNPGRIPPRLLMAATYIKLGRKEDAEWLVAEVLAIKPDFKLDKIERIHPFQTDAEIETYKDLLHQAGLK